MCAANNNASNYTVKQTIAIAQKKEEEMKIIVSLLKNLSRVERKLTKTNFSLCLVERIIFSIIKKVQPLPPVKKIKEISGNVIWTAWFQGVSAAPDLVLCCISSFRNINNSNVIVITKENLSDYIEIPINILNKYRAGMISNTAFSEIVRIELLSTYGGLWLDSTVFITSKIEYPVLGGFFTLKGVSKLKCGEFSGLTPVYMIGCEEGYKPILEIRENLLSYWMVNDNQIDYYLIDYIFKLEMLGNLSFKRDVDALPIIGMKRFKLSGVINEIYNEDNWQELMGESMAYKLTNKSDVCCFVDGKKTFFKKIKEEYK